MGAGGDDDADGDRPTRDPTDPRTVRVLAVTTADVLSALEANERRGRSVVLRVTPPFAGRMRARLHRRGSEGDYEGAARPVHVPPERFLDDPPAFPTVDNTEDELRAEGSYTRERHRERHASAVESWRETVQNSLAERVIIETPEGPHEVRVSYLG
jgi:hypothetical protein